VLYAGSKKFVLLKFYFNISKNASTKKACSILWGKTLIFLLNLMQYEKKCLFVLKYQYYLMGE